ncbi:unnamed protein product [Rangifer tarandus platyrhynchus]|uniref:Uncharacterized protein n=1 Tax=Rangifer tarandus platyrhynchus TaxID=3082113 RepID=A0AC60A3G5_RANTA
MRRQAAVTVTSHVKHLINPNPPPHTHTTSCLQLPYCPCPSGLKTCRMLPGKPRPQLLQQIRVVSALPMPMSLVLCPSIPRDWEYASHNHPGPSTRNGLAQAATRETAIASFAQRPFPRPRPRTQLSTAFANG